MSTTEAMTISKMITKKLSKNTHQIFSGKTGMKKN
jgi:hypothetical protein